MEGLGIEPSSTALQAVAGMTTLAHPPVLVLKGVIELPIQSYQDCVMPFNYKSLGYPMGFEPMLLEPQPKVLTANTTDTIDWQGVQGSSL